MKITFSIVMCSKHYNCKCGRWMEWNWSHPTFESWQGNENKRNQVSCALQWAPHSVGKGTDLKPQGHWGCLEGQAPVPPSPVWQECSVALDSGQEYLWASFIHGIMHHPSIHNLSKFYSLPSCGIHLSLRGFSYDSLLVFTTGTHQA